MFCDLHYSFENTNLFVDNIENHQIEFMPLRIQIFNNGNVVEFVSHFRNALEHCCHHLGRVVPHVEHVVNAEGGQTVIDVGYAWIVIRRREIAHHGYLGRQ